VDTDKELIEVYEMKEEGYELQPAKNSYDFNFEDSCSVKTDFSKVFY